MNTETILQFQDVTIASEKAGGVRLDTCSLQLAAGDMCLVLSELQTFASLLGDVCCGLESPDSGAVYFDGANWADLSPAEAAAKRSQLGRVFEEFGWVSNLNIDENVTLAARMHVCHSEEKIYELAQACAERLTGSGLSAERPAWEDKTRLQQFQWVRALYLQPKLVVLEFPEQHMSQQDLAPLYKEVESVRREGTAVIWITDKSAATLNTELTNTTTMRIIDGYLREQT